MWLQFHWCGRLPFKSRFQRILRVERSTGITRCIHVFLFNYQISMTWGDPADPDTFAWG